MGRHPTILKLVLLCGLLAGCLNPRSYPDPAFPMVGYDKVERLPQPISLRVQVSFERQGTAYSRGDTYLRDITERVLRGSGVVIPDAAAGGGIKVVVNNSADIGDAAAKGIGTGLTFGLVGTTVSDNYEMSVTVTYAGRTVTRTGLKGAVRSAMGNTGVPPGVQATSPTQAFERVVEGLLLGAIADMQRTGDLPRPSGPTPRTS